ncbi:MAG: acyl-CoA dehydrogenase family protein [Bdellovibrionales bacterium]|nr:acyl-CoA dehydrogenase family protein [Bdellovibrionales bacterium]
METTLDLLDLEADWTGEHKEIVSSVRRYVDTEVLPRMKEHQRAGTFPKDVLPGLAKLGLLEALATNSLDPVAYGLAMRELERAGSTIRSFASVQGSLVMSAIEMLGTDSQKKEWLPSLGRLEAIGCFGLTEPDFGSNPAGMRTKAEKTAKGYKLSGQKCWITNGMAAKVAVIWAKLDGTVNGFLVPTATPGFEAREIRDKWSFRTSDTAELFLQDVEVPESARLPKAQSLGSALKCLNQARYGIAWGVVGAAMACFEETRRYLVERPQFNGRPLASHQLIQSKLAWMATEITTMQLLAKRLGELKSEDRLQPQQVSLGKMNNCRKALEVARTCRDLLGAAGIHHEHHVGRHLTDLETVLTYEGTEHIHSLILGEHLTGIPAYV